MNIAKLQAQLQKVPDQALIGYVKNPDGQVPSFLALAELTRRKEARKAAAPKEQMPTQTVAQQTVAQAEPGIAQLPVPDTMFSEQAMAAGGIVAFADGGDVPSFAGPKGSLVESSGLTLDDLSLLANQAEQQQRDAAMAAYLEANKNKPRPIGNADQAQATYRAPGMYPNFQANRQEVIGNSNYAGQTPFNKFGLGNDVSILRNYKDDVVAPVAVPPDFLKKNEAAPAVIAEEKAKKVMQEKGPAVGGINYNLPNRLNDVTVPDAVKLNREDFVGEAPTLAGIQALRKEAYKEAGVNEDLYTKMQEDIEGRRANLGKEKDASVANAMIMAGLGIAGGRDRNAITNIAQGAMPAIKELRTDMKELDAKKDKLSEREFAVMEAQNKFRQTGADSDLKSLTDKQAAYDVAKRDYAKTDAQLQDSQVGRKFSLETQKAQEAGQTDRAILSAKLQEQQINVSAFNAQTQRMIANKPELFTTIMNNLEQDPDYKKADGKGRVKMITEAVSDAKSTSAAGLNDNTLRTKALDITSKYFEPGGAGHTKYKALMKTDPAAATKMYNDYFNQQLGLAKSTLGAAPTSSADPLGIL